MGSPLDARQWADSLGCSVEACALLIDADFIDLHVDLEVPIRLYGYDPAVHHGVSRRVRPFFGHTDYPRIREARLTGVVYDLATNPFRTELDRLATTLDNVRAAQARIAAHPADLEVVVDHAGYLKARAAGRTAMWLALQGGNALSADPSRLRGWLGGLLHRITLVHLTNSDLGGTSSPGGGDGGITEAGRRMVAACNDARVLVDLAHAGRRTFAEALDAHAPDLPPIVSHTGVCGVHPHWRNLEDGQIRAIADRGGVVGIMYQSNFLAPTRTTCKRARILDHIAHVIAVGGEGVAAIGTDYDGMIVPPRELADVTHHPLQVQDMLDRGWTEARIRGVLGANYLDVVRSIRPG